MGSDIQPPCSLSASGAYQPMLRTVLGGTRTAGRSSHVGAAACLPSPQARDRRGSVCHAFGEQELWHQPPLRAGVLQCTPTFVWYPKILMPCCSRSRSCFSHWAWLVCSKRIASPSTVLSLACRCCQHKAAPTLPRWSEAHHDVDWRWTWYVSSWSITAQAFVPVCRPMTSNILRNIWAVPPPGVTGYVKTHRGAGVS